MAGGRHLEFQDGQRTKQSSYVFNGLLYPQNIGIELEIMVVSHPEAVILVPMGYFTMEDGGHLEIQDD